MPLPSFLPFPLPFTDFSPHPLQDSNASLGTRASAGLDAVGDKFDESKHDAKAEANKQSI